MPIRHRSLLIAVAFAPFMTTACTLAKITQNGYTIVGNNEDAWSINARIRFENGKPGEFGAVYLCHFNGSPLRSMTDQGGMNEAGLMYDGFVVEPKNVVPTPGLKRGDFSDLMPLVMRTCATVQDAATLIGNYDMSSLRHSMIVLVDHHGDYLVVESDTLITGHDPTFVAGNFRPSTCTNFDAVPIPRYQKGRALLAQGTDTSLTFCTAVMDSMRACRTKLGNGTLYTNILDLQRGLIHLYFYHDYSEVRTFNLKEELAKGDHSYEMVSLFGKRPEFEALVSYITPFHQRWLFWGLLGVVLVAVLAGSYAAVALLRSVIARLRHRAADPLLPLISMGLVSLLIVVLVGVLLLNEGAYYFGLGDVDPVLAWLPLVLALLAVPVIRTALASGEQRRTGLFVLFSRTVSLSVLTLLGFALYWHLLLP